MCLHVWRNLGWDTVSIKTILHWLECVKRKSVYTTIYSKLVLAATLSANNCQWQSYMEDINYTTHSLEIRAQSKMACPTLSAMSTMKGCHKLKAYEPQTAMKVGMLNDAPWSVEFKSIHKWKGFRGNCRALQFWEGVRIYSPSLHIMMVSFWIYSSMKNEIIGLIRNQQGI